MDVERLERRLAPAVTTPFTVRYTANDTGDITFAANTLMTAGPPATPQQIADVQNGVGKKLNNNDFTMTYVDIDADVSTFNSSSAALVMPAGSEVLFAGLYWGARTNASFPTGLTAKRDTVRLKAPGDNAYRTLTGTTIGTTDSSYQSFVDVTGIVRAAEGGIYTAADVQSITNSSDYYAGWSLVVAYRAPGLPARNLTVFDGYGKVANSTGDKTIDVPISGFKAPPSGPVKATLGFITYEGDLASTGDQVLFDGGLGPKRLSDAANPADNFFNSTISNRGSLVTTKTPNYVNQMGFDANLITANGVIKNAATSAKITLTTGGETYYPGVVTSAIDLFAPEITLTKRVTDLDGGAVEAGDVLRYTMTVTNSPAALDAAVNVLLDDVIPAHTTYKPGSLVITAGDGVGTKTDAADTDQAETVGSGSVSGIRFQLGTGAGGAGTSGGRLAPGQSTTVTFDVTVDAGIPPATLIENTAEASYTGETSGFNLSATGFADIATPTAADLAVTKTDGKSHYVPGTTSTYTIVVANNGPSDVSGARVLDILPAAFANPTWTATWSMGSMAPITNGSGTIDRLVDLRNGETVTFVVTAPIRAETTGNISNVVTVTPPAGVPDPKPDDNTAIDTDTFLAPATLSVRKSVRDVNGGVVMAGDRLRYTIVVSNAAASPAEAAAGVTLSDLIPANSTYAGNLTFSQGSGTGSQSAGINGNLGTLAAGAFATVAFDVTVDTGIAPGTVITNTANATGTGAVSGLALAGSDGVGIATPTAADLRIVKQSSPTFTAGTRVSYLLQVANSGPSAVTGATVTDVLPAGLSNATWTATYPAGGSGPASGSGDVNASIDLPVRGVARFTIFADLDPAFAAPGSISNTATVKNQAGVPDANPEDNTSTLVTPTRAVTDLAVTKTDGRVQYVPGSPVTYTVVVTNSGPSLARQASVTDVLDPAIIASATWTAVFTGTGSAGDTAGSGSLDEIIDLAAGGTATYTIVAQTLPDATASLVNTVVVSPSNLSTDPNPGDNAATDTDTVLLPAALKVVKTVLDVNGQFVVPGDTLRYTIVVSNAAGSPAREAAVSVVLQDLIPAHTTYAGNLSTTQGSLSGSQAGGVTGSLGTIAAGGSVTITFDVTVDAETPDSTVIANTATVTGAGQTSGQPLLARDAVGVVTPPGADLKVVKTAPTTYVPGSPLTSTIVVSNSGPSTSTNARIEDVLPAGVTGFSWSAVTAGGATVAASAGSGAIATTATLPTGGTVTFTVVAQTDPAFRAAITNVATVTPTDGKPDPNPGNDRSTATSTPTPTADLSIVKTDGESSYTPGRSVTYTITVTNGGPSAVTGARVRDAFPSIVTVATWTAAVTSGAAAIANTSGTGDIDELVDLDPGAVVTYTVTAMTSSAALTNLVNTATIAAPAGVIDPAPGNDASTDVDTPNVSPAVILGTDLGCTSTPLVQVLDPVTGAVRTRFLAYDPNFRGGVHVLGADVTGDAIPEIITAPGAGLPGLVKVFTQGGVELPEYRVFPFGAGYTSGIELAAGPVTGPGRIDLVVGQQKGGNLVRVLPVIPGVGIAGAASREFRPFGAAFRGGVTLAAADLGTFSGGTFVAAAPDGITEIIVGSGPGMRATVTTYNGVPIPPTIVNTVHPISTAYSNGVSVAALPVAAGVADKYLVSAGVNGGSRVETYTGVGTLRAAAFAAFGGAAGRRPDVWTAALGGSQIFSVQGQFGRTGGVRKNTAPSGGVSSTLPGSTSILPPLRIGTLRR